ncbi:ScbA/BarX family gamma-butyrolactone biosynthesis protein [Streptomyces griseoviridis]|jgi:hypothetical protein|uniref:A-factor biosynthesis hotdog domain-containing protein n=1 Tax=Streptomyces griseoviridis TaxID=45398 RepID=A0ABT9LQ58_STRGD|nr:ScbA/BarX family gamma-butyrolactone biosynthesis protein [Streptomyces griseoviridis]MDP9685672.1 hypothetical protein [Streptomyces griseoviridis]GGS89146.1 adhesin [Streptomyces griseoviridis]
MSASAFRVGKVMSGAPYSEDGSAAPAGLGAPRRPALTTTVPRELVHRASVAEVLLTGWDRVDDARFTVTAQLPRQHGFHVSVGGCHDPLLITETVRQAGLLLAHAELGVPLEHQFLMWDLSADVVPEALRVGGAPASLDIDVACEDVKRRGAQVAGAHYDMVIRRDGEVAARGGATFTCTSPAVYRRLRAAARAGAGAPVPLPLPSPAPPREVGRVSAADVVLSPSPAAGRWRLRADTTHPALFDHPVDHVPGMVLLEAARQATTAFLRRPCLPVGLTGEFSRYVELDRECAIEACALPGGAAEGRERVLVTGRQDGGQVFRATVTAAPVPL